MVPVAAVIDPEVIGYLGPGAVIDWEVLREEIERYRLWGRVFVHPHAAVLTYEDRISEQQLSSSGGIPGSTKKGVGSCRSRRALRTALVADEVSGMAKFVDWNLKFYSRMLESAHSNSKAVLVEGSQGFWLSLWHGDYPYVTSADCSPAAVLSEAGLPTDNVMKVCVLRTYPIRVGGPSGPFHSREISWKEIGVEPETTTVTGRVRRVAEFEWDRLELMAKITSPDSIAVNFADYLDPDIAQKPVSDSPAVFDFLKRVSRVSGGVPVRWLGVGGEEYIVREIFVQEGPRCVTKRGLRVNR
jgi:adenylosuccinate synthase